MIYMEQELDQCVFIKLSHRDYSDGGWASYIVGGDGKAGALMKSCGGEHPLRKYAIRIFVISHQVWVEKSNAAGIRKK